MYRGKLRAVSGWVIEEHEARSWQCADRRGLWEAKPEDQKGLMSETLRYRARKVIECEVGGRNQEGLCNAKGKQKRH